MKQKVLGATLVLSAPVNSFASYSSKGDGKVDLSKLEKVDALTELEITINEGVKFKLSSLKVKGTNNNTNFACNKDDFQKDSYEVILDLGEKETKAEEGEVICVYKISTEDDGKKLKLDAISSFDKLEAGSYVIISSADKKKSIKIVKKVFGKKQKLESKKTYKDDDGK